jgi:hypothetical protein
MASPEVKGREKSWEAHQRDKHFDENTTSKSNKSKRSDHVNARIRSVAAMPAGLHEIIEKVATQLEHPCPAIFQESFFLFID